MVVQFARWGNSLAVRIPVSIAKEIGASEGGAADLYVEDGHIVLTPKKAAKFSAESLIAAINAGNVHSETLTGESIGAETLDDYEDICS